jgi:excisionase family DNA binding protein
MAGTILTPKELAKRLRVSPGTVRRWVEREGLPAIRLTRRTIRFEPIAVDRWLRSRGHVTPPVPAVCLKDAEDSQ